jgi:hypothetical protein
MTSLTILETQLPAKLEDLAKFILVGREKLNSVRAEIRAIDKLSLAQEVRNQKKEEALMLSEALLDAEVKLGDLLKQIPKQTGIRTDLTSLQQCDEVKTAKPKHEIIKSLGFNKDQAHRFETLADNKDLVEQVKAEARENDDIPTRSRVLDLAQQRKKREEEEAQKNADYNKYLDHCKKVANGFNKVIYDSAMLQVNDEHLNAWKELLDDPKMINRYIELINEIIPNMLKIKSFLKEMSK